MVILIVFLVFVALLAIGVHANHRQMRRLTSAPHGATRVETVKAHQVDVTIRQHTATGWRLVDQSSAKSFGSEARVTLTFRRDSTPLADGEPVVVPGGAAHRFPSRV